MEAAPPGVTFHLLARAVIVDGRRLLLAHLHGADHTFLPGGHLEPGESLPAALRRELMEELQVRADIGNYLGALEHTWTEAGIRHFEVNHCFAVTVPEMSPAVKPRSYAEHLEFLWAPVHDLKAHNLQPVLLWTLVPRWIGGDGSPWWGSTLPP